MQGASHPDPRRRRRRILGATAVTAAVVGLVCLLSADVVRRPFGRTLAVIGGDVFGTSRETGPVQLGSVDGIMAGAPIFSDGGGALRPVAHVSRVDAKARRVWVTFAPGEAVVEPRLEVLQAPRSFGEMFALAVPPDTAAALGARLRERVGRVFADEIVPELESRLPAFLERIDPREDAKTKRLLEQIGGDVAAALEPYGNRLASHVLKDIEKQLDLLDRMGLLVKMVTGDGEGIRERLEPVARESAETWWAAHRDDVLAAVGRSLGGRREEVQTWLAEDVLPVAERELLRPIWAARRPALEREAEAAAREVIDAVVVAEDGGFRLRFVVLLRSRLLGKRAPLILLAPTTG